MTRVRRGHGDGVLMMGLVPLGEEILDRHVYHIPSPAHTEKNSHVHISRRPPSTAQKESSHQKLTRLAP